jgi:parallel beta-helix repeat protein
VQPLIGLYLTSAGNNTVRGLVIVRFYTGIQLDASSGNTIAGANSATNQFFRLNM